MVNVNLPAHLQNRQSKAVNERAAAGIGSSMPPHISIQGNSFTLIDAAGNEQNEGGVIEVCIADVSDVTCKRYYGDKKWTPDSKDPPVCWSSNGLGPSRDSTSPQNSICATCPKNERGSAISAVSGAAIKACRDEKWLALIMPKYPTMIFQLVLTPGSFKNWRDFLKPFETHGVDISDAVVRIQFEPKVTGVLQFAAATTPQGGSIWIDEGVFKAREGALLGKATDALVGRNDVPIAAALGAPAQVQQIEAPQAAPFGSAPAAAIPFTPPAQPQAQPFQPASEPATNAAPVRRQRRTAAQIAADNAAEAGQGQSAAPFGGQQAGIATSPSSAPQNAPFAPQPAAAPFAANPAPQAAGGFGMAPGTAPDPGLQNTLNGLFGPK